ncbi:hypothetical protein GCM10028778_24370 [Barrientosiimonas marina]|uniref:hypothetical protein n=1 Tax=Lentibacillus kimchii TaxID=1542911 RepID=UPI0036D3431F
MTAIVVKTAGMVRINKEKSIFLNHQVINNITLPIKTATRKGAKTIMLLNPFWYLFYST